MIVTRLIGGLGNQLFQYAAGRRLAYARGTELKLDVSGLDSPDHRTVRSYELAPFNIKQTFATEEEVATLTQSDTNLLRRIVCRIIGKNKRHLLSYIKEPHYHFAPYVLDLPDGMYLDGYWQSERYFSDVEDLIRKEVTVARPLEGRNIELARKIAECQAVSLHVRRGDYISDPVVQSVHGTCGLDYYEQAVAYISTRLGTPVFFLFSDDPAWVKKHLKLSYPMQIVDHNDPDHGYEDLRLMSLCHHHIIANSSFSWWGAWLNAHTDKIVVAPRRWFMDPTRDTSDLCPASWVRL